ncbi:hypothetical protein CNECB9_5260007 [Cupriavidus necator]|uniref:Uncharacterized protein n=1 Tax=Cupriavidus necator TaxID=106590 RepID=A0A1K0IPT2_CUPNE|nr:hypothetical protein CNECB9_5260007 [Cupriavidus necator]
MIVTFLYVREAARRTCMNIQANSAFRVRRLKSVGGREKGNQGNLTEKNTGNALLDKGFWVLGKR